MAQVELYKQTGTYVNKDGVEKNFTNFYVKCGDELVPVTVKFFENDEGNDPRYAPRKAVMSAFASLLPPLPERKETDKGRKKASGLVADDDGDHPF